MIKKKAPLSQDPNLLFSMNFSAPTGIEEAMVEELLVQVPKKMKAKAGIDVKGRKETIQVGGGLFNKKECAGCVFRFTDKPRYAELLVGFNRVAMLVNVDVVPLGEVSKTMQRKYYVDHCKKENPLSFTAALKGLMVNENAVDEETTYYSMISQVIKECISSWQA